MSCTKLSFVYLDAPSGMQSTLHHLLRGRWSAFSWVLGAANAMGESELRALSILVSSASC